MGKRRKPPTAPLPSAGSSYSLREHPPEPGFRMPNDFHYTARGKPCSDKFNKVGKGQCLVQLTFDEGMPALRFCDEAGKPGQLVHVSSAEEAVEASSAICDCFEATGSFDQCLPEGLKLGAPAAAAPIMMVPTLGKLPGLRGLPAGGFGKAPPSKKRRRSGARGGTAGLPRGSSCKIVGKLDAKKRNALPATAFGIPERREYPMPDPRHAKNAKSRAKAQLNKGKLERRDYNRIVRKADRVIRACGGRR